MTTKVNTSNIAASELVARLANVATLVDLAEVEPANLAVSSGGNVTVQCRAADDVDAVMEYLDDAPAPYGSSPTLYTRWGTFDEVVGVQVYGPARTNACACGAGCDHKAGAR